MEKLEVGQQRITMAHVARAFCAVSSIVHLFLVALMLWRGEWVLVIITALAAYGYMSLWLYMDEWIAANNTRTGAKLEGRDG